MAFKQAIIVNQDLKMTAGQIAERVARAEVIYMEHIMYDGRGIDNHLSWRRENRGKSEIALLKTTGDEISKLTWKFRPNIWARPVFSEGLSWIPDGGLTCIIVDPLQEDKFKELFGHLSPL